MTALLIPEPPVEMQHAAQWYPVYYSIEEARRLLDENKKQETTRVVMSFTAEAQATMGDALTDLMRLTTIHSIPVEYELEAKNGMPSDLIALTVYGEKDRVRLTASAEFVKGWYESHS